MALVAGEASGDQLGAGLIEAARRLHPGLECFGIAGPAMKAAGCRAWHDTEELSVMGLTEVLRHLPRLVRLRRALVGRLLADPPDVFVGIDAPDFNLPLAARVRAAGVPTVHYVCPSVWAWRQGRVRLLGRACDQVLCLLPFEAPFLERAGVPATFVGHPFADQIRAEPDTAPARARLGLDAATVIGLLPGSRSAEIERLGPVFLEAATRLQAELPDAAFVAPMANARLHEVFAGLARRSGPGLRLTLVDGRVREVIAASDALLATSGTVTLEAMLVNRPMVVAYRASPVTYALATTLHLVKVSHFSLPNLLADERLVPELLQGEATPARLAGEVLALLRSPARLDALRSRFELIGQQLRRDASAVAARVVTGLVRAG